LVSPSNASVVVATPPTSSISTTKFNNNSFVQV
jgi:hypothetical protein